MLLPSNEGQEMDGEHLAFSASYKILESHCWKMCRGLAVAVETVLRIFEAVDLILSWKKKYSVLLSFGPFQDGSKHSHHRGLELW